MRAAAYAKATSRWLNGDCTASRVHCFFWLNTRAGRCLRCNPLRCSSPSPSTMNPRSWCQEAHPFAWADTPSGKTIFLSILMVILAIVIEVGLHRTKGPPSPPDELIGRISDPPTNRTGCRDVQEVKRRANRFVVATLAIVPLWIAFAFRIPDTQVSSLGDCAGKISFAPPNWFAITIFNILPLTCASTAWLGSLIDCVLARFNRSMPYHYWPPALPIYGVFILLKIMLETATLHLMGGLKPASSAQTGLYRGDIEAAGGWELERQNLMQDDDAEGTEDDYLTVCESKDSEDGKILSETA